MPYSTFLFDADDTLFDFGASEKQAFTSTLNGVGYNDDIDPVFASYKIANAKMWAAHEQGQITKDFMRGERFRLTFETHKLALDHDRAGHLYLEMLPETCVVIDHALKLLQYLSANGTVGIITNGFETVQTRRLKKSGLAPYVKFVVVSEACGFAKPDVRFFEHTATQHLPGISKDQILVIGDRAETDVLGAHNFGVDACWFNPSKKALPLGITPPKYTIAHLSEITNIVKK